MGSVPFTQSSFRSELIQIVWIFNLAGTKIRKMINPFFSKGL